MRLHDVLATGRLATRESDSDPQFSSAIALPRRSVARGRAWVEVSLRVMALTGAHSAGISLLNNARHDELTWIAARGSLTEFSLRRFPRRHSMCGVVLDEQSPQLFLRPHRYFRWMSRAGITVDEALVVPLHIQGELCGTIWAMTHFEAYSFTARDVQLLRDLGDYGSAIVTWSANGAPLGHGSA